MTNDTPNLGKLRALLERVQYNAAHPPERVPPSVKTPNVDTVQAKDSPAMVTVPQRPPVTSAAVPSAATPSAATPSEPIPSAVTPSEPIPSAPRPWQPSRKPDAVTPAPIASRPPVQVSRAPQSQVSEPFPQAPSMELRSASDAPPDAAESLRAESQSDFEAIVSAPQEVESDFDKSAPPPLEEFEAPPISSEHQREDELDEFGDGMGFASGPRQEVEDELELASAPRTPPPESGPQMSIPPKEAEFVAAAQHRDVPTMEQLGSTIDFDEDDTTQELELEERAPSVVAPRHADEFEAALPSNTYAGAYDDSLPPPPDAREELAQHDRQEQEREVRRSQLPPIPPVTRPPVTGIELGSAEVIGRPEPGLGSPAVYEHRQLRISTLSFVERLDASLALTLRH